MRKTQEKRGLFLQKEIPSWSWYGYSNNTPILEVKIVNHKDNYIYILQIQGAQYRHGVVAKHPTKKFSILKIG